jgi:hypothetical protein
MATFAQAVEASPVPGTTLLLELWVFADEWETKHKLHGAVCVGLRLLADKEKTKARFTAEELADQVHPARDHNWIDAYNDALMRQVAALALCDPNDVRKPFEFMQYAESDVSDALTSAGVTFIFRAFERYERETDANVAPAGAAEIKRLGALLPFVEPAQLRVGLRRTISEVLEELDLLVGDSVDDSAIDDASHEAIPVVRQ